jgi:hypothetical protein
MVSDRTRTPPEPPERLREVGQNLWNSIQKEFAITDCGSVELLTQACLAADRADELGRTINRDGPVVCDAKGNTREHPLLKAELGNRAFLCRILQRLGIVDEDLKSVGRPATGRLAGWDGVPR